MPKKLWSGRFSERTHELAELYSESLSFDYRLVVEDVRASQVHAEMLGRQGIIPKAEARKIKEGLESVLHEILEELRAGTFNPHAGEEDIHMLVEARLTKKIGPVGGKLHTARSRNDQVATDMRLYLKTQGILVAEHIHELQGVILALAERHLSVIMPGYTHLQRAQPVLFSHHLMAYFWMLERDRDRLWDCMTRADQCPLGAGALAGTTFPIDRQFVSQRLGFAEPCPNSIDAVSDRDFLVEFCSFAALLMTHFSRLSEELILWSSSEFGFIEISDQFTTGSSIMPQKKNPDIAELARGKAGRVIGDLVALLTLLKGLPLAYNRDLQEDKLSFFNALDEVKSTLGVFTPMLRSIKVNKDQMRKAAADGYLNATEVADYLAKKGMPFRQAHEAAGKLVAEALKKNKKLEELKLSEYKKHSALFGPDLYKYLTLEAMVERRKISGGTAPAEVKKQIQAARKLWGE
jgi:argininosuccinate lyase